MTLILSVAALVVVGAVGALAARRMSAAARAPIPNNECVSCGSGNVQAQGPTTYVCLECGYEGGAGRAEQAAQAELDRYADLTAEERLDRVTEHVRTAARILASYDPTVERPEVEDEQFEAALTELGPGKASIAVELSEAASELRLAQRIAGGRILLANRLVVDAEGVSAALMSVQRAAAMETTAAQAHAYLQAVLRGSGRIPMPPRPPS